MKDKNKNKVENESGYMAMGICLGMSLGANAKEDGKDEAFQTQPKEEERGR